MAEHQNLLDTLLAEVGSFTEKLYLDIHGY